MFRKMSNGWSRNPRRNTFACWLAVIISTLCPCDDEGQLQAGILEFAGISDNRSEYPDGTIPRYRKLEIRFQIAGTIADNLQLPFDPDPPPGIEPGIGISVGAQFTPDDWETVYRVPAFYYQDFLHEFRGRGEWIYPTENFSWMVRFAPHRTGTWQYKLTVRDRSGTAESAVRSFEVSCSSSPGFVRVSSRDRRYFEFENGTYFPALGYNYHPFSLNNPVLDQRDHFRMMSENGIQLLRIWFPPTSIYGAEWNPWNSPDPKLHGGYLPFNGISFEEAYPGSDVSMKISSEGNACMFIGAWKARPAVKRDTDYRVRIRFKTLGMTGPRDASRPFGFVAKTGGWLWGEKEGERCDSPSTGIRVTPHFTRNTDDWEILEGTLNSGQSDFLTDFYLVLENTVAGSVFVDRVWIEEDLGNGLYGPNIVSKPWMAHHLYFEQRSSYAFDKFLELAREHGVYFKATILEKNDRILNRIDGRGNPDPASRGNDNFYGDWRKMTKVRWLQRAWWRYLQARWGYSTQIQSWELLNEGDPFSSRHYALADELGKFMRQFQPNHHLVTTSTWHSFPKTAFWASEDYPHVDYADVHRYVSRGKETRLRVDNAEQTIATPEDYFDAAAVTGRLSDLMGAQNLGKPVIRGETGFVLDYSGPPDPQLFEDHKGFWLHNFVWGGVRAGGLIESLWYDTDHIYRRNRKGSYLFDHRPLFGAFYRFIRNIPLSGGHYVDAAAEVSDPRLRVWGQKDLTHSRAHLWIQNKRHTWKNALDAEVPLVPVSGIVSVSGFPPDMSLSVNWWDTWAGSSLSLQKQTTDQAGRLILSIEDLLSDVAVKIGEYPD